MNKELQKHFEHHDGRIREMFGGRHPKEPIFLTGLPAHEEEDMLSDFNKVKERALADIGNILPVLSKNTFYSPVAEIWPFGVHYLDVIFGCKVFHRSGTIFAKKLSCRPGKLKRPDLGSSDVFLRSYELAKFLLDSVPPEIKISTPVLSSPLNIATNLFGGEFLVTLMEKRDEAVSALETITGIIIELHKAFGMLGPRVRPYAASSRYTPDGFGHICGCSTHRVSGRTYAETIVAFDEQVLSVYPEGGTMHLCGKHLQHADAFKKMKKLRGIQINDAAADDFEGYLAGLREDQVIYVAPTASVTAQKIIEKGKGRRVIIQGVCPK